MRYPKRRKEGGREHNGAHTRAVDTPFCASVWEGTKNVRADEGERGRKEARGERVERWQVGSLCQTSSVQQDRPRRHEQVWVKQSSGLGVC